VALSEAVAQVLSDANLRARLAAGARELSKLFTWEKIARRTVEEAYR